MVGSRSESHVLEIKKSIGSWLESRVCNTARAVLGGSSFLPVREDIRRGVELDAIWF